MTKEELIALGEKAETPETTTAVEEKTTPVENAKEATKEPRQSTAPPFPEDTPEWAKKRIAELSGKNAALKAQRDQEAGLRADAPRNYE